MELEATWPRTIVLWWSCAWRSFSLFLGIVVVALIFFSILDAIGLGSALLSPSWFEFLAYVSGILALASFSACQLVGIKYSLRVGFNEFRVRAFSRSGDRLKPDWPLAKRLWWAHLARAYALTALVAVLLLILGTFSWECLACTFVVLSIGVTQHILSEDLSDFSVKLWGRLDKRKAREEENNLPGLAPEIVDIWGGGEAA